MEGIIAGVEYPLEVTNLKSQGVIVMLWEKGLRISIKTQNSCCLSCTHADIFLTVTVIILLLEDVGTEVDVVVVIVEVVVDVVVLDVGIDVGVDVGVAGLVCMKNKKPIAAITTTTIPTKAINKEFLCMVVYTNVKYLNFYLKLYIINLGE
jgi:hypothetical protein